MSHIHQSYDCRVLRTPPRAPERWRTILNVIVMLLEAFKEAEEMRRAAHPKYPFEEE
jgi:hypothetical protein